MDKHDPQKKVGLMVDGWGTWHDPAPDRDMGALYQQNSLRDAVAGLNLNIFNNHSDRVLTAQAMNATNTFERPELVRPAPFDAFRTQAGTTTLTLPPKSVVVLELR